MTSAVATIERVQRHVQGSSRAKWVGRATLYSVTLFLALFALSSALAVLWLLPPLRDTAWFVHLFRVVLAAGFVCGAAVVFNLFVLHRFLVPPRDFLYSPLSGARVHAALTAYNDEDCIAQAVKDFKRCPEVHTVIVVENNSKDRTAQAARDAGADRVVTETVPGYGSCCMRSLAEAADGLRDEDIIVLCEGDMTFVAADVKKFVAYLENCDLVLGTRATQELRESTTQMDWLINPGNQIVAKLIQSRFWGTRLTDCGCTYRAMRVSSYRVLRDRLSIRGNHFSPHMYIEALKLGMRVIEIPVVFRARLGTSKGVGSNKIKATKVALAMLKMLYTA